MQSFSAVLKTLTRRIRALQRTRITPPSEPQPEPRHEDETPASRSFYRAEAPQWGLDTENALLRRLEQNAPECRHPAPRSFSRSPGSTRRRPRRSLRSRLATSHLPSPRGLLNGR